MRQETVEELNLEEIKTERGPADNLIQKTINETFKVERAFEKNRSRLRRKIRTVKTTWRLACRPTCRPTWRTTWRPSRISLLRLREESDILTRQKAYTLIVTGTKQNEERSMTA